MVWMYHSQSCFWVFRKKQQSALHKTFPTDVGAKVVDVSTDVNKKHLEGL